MISGINSPQIAGLVTTAAGSSYDAALAKYVSLANGVLEQTSQEKPALDAELEEKAEEKKRQARQYNQPLKPWSFIDVILTLSLFVLAFIGMLIEWNAISQLLMRAEPLKHNGLLSGLLSTGLVLFMGALAKFQCPDIRDNYPGNKKYLFALFLISILSALFWLLCFAARNADTSLNSLATRLISPVISPAHEKFESRLFLIQTIAQTLGSAMVAAYLFLKGENLIRTHRRRKNLGASGPITAADVDFDDVQARHRSLMAAALRARAMLNEISAQRTAFVAKWMAQVDLIMEIRATLETHIGPFTITPEKRHDRRS
jgi:hypothetical protein